MHVLMTALQPGGGIRTFFRYIYSQPDFSGDRFTLIAPDADHQLAEFLIPILGEDRFKIVSAPNDVIGFVRVIRKELDIPGYDLIHSHGFGAGLLTEVATFGRKAPKHLMTAHDVFLETQFNSWKGKFRKYVMAKLFAKMHAIHTVTNDATENFIEFFPNLPRSCFRPILHGVDTEFFASGQPIDLRRKLQIPLDVPLIGFFGRFMGQKGFRTLVDALVILKGDQFKPMPKVLTFGWGGFIREDYEYLASAGLADYFVQLPATNDMPAMIKSVDMVAMPSRWEACGLLAMEVLASGTPLLSTDCIGLQEVVAGSPARIFAPGDAKSLAKLIKAEIEVSSREEFLVYQKTAIERFHISIPASRLRVLYDEVLGV